MNVLVLGSGGREHALCHALARSKRLKRLFILPGNAGTATLGTNVAGSPTDIDLTLEVARRENIDLTVVGPEDPLAAGIVDAFRDAGLRIFGPTAAAARLEADKVFAKQLMRQHAIPTAEARTFADATHARQYIATRDAPVVVKVAGLARGKGVFVCDDPADAILAAERILKEGLFGQAGRTIVVEERLDGREVSVLALVDRRTIFVLDPAQDYKRLGDGNTGPNTGGMGAYSPADTISPATMTQIESQILVPTLNALLTEGLDYQGLLYFGLMLTPGGPKVLEYNCRFGDPETQVLLPRLKTDLLDLLETTANGRLETATINWDTRHAVCVVMASRGYPGQVETGHVIRGLPDTSHGANADASYGLNTDASRGSRDDDLLVFHAGTRIDKRGQVVTAGGRVLGVTALAPTRVEARERAYAAVEQIDFEGAIYRHDIAADPL